MAPQSDMILQENEGLPCEEKKQELHEDEDEDENENENEDENENENEDKGKDKDKKKPIRCREARPHGDSFIHSIDCSRTNTDYK